MNRSYGINLFTVNKSITEFVPCCCFFYLFYMKCPVFLYILCLLIILVSSNYRRFSRNIYLNNEHKYLNSFKSSTFLRDSFLVIFIYRLKISQETQLLWYKRITNITKHCNFISVSPMFNFTSFWSNPLYTDLLTLFYLVQITLRK